MDVTCDENEDDRFDLTQKLATLKPKDKEPLTMETGVECRVH